MYKGIRKRKRENLQDVELAQIKCQNFSMSKMIICNILAIFLHVKNQPLAIGWLWRWEVCFERVEVEK
jgi:hypothetical protein